MTPEEKKEAFKKELKTLLEKYNASIWCDIEGDTHGLSETMMVDIDGNDHRLSGGNDIDKSDL